ncbi:hypothetical protein PENSPDRAFT_688340 [Peniophora sp. CONT]|nr:hypothetical protein PENSPDRAFT_688340 [Peniophora sp. CONT]
MGDFAQSTSVVDSLRSIVNQYPHGVGTFRELLQNSDDAGATEQVFVLDRRAHVGGAGFDPGPAFLAYNNAIVTDNDWVGLQKINSSPKRTDTEKTGKYGLGFRSTFHITDTPEILSGRYLATFDPLKRVLATEGAKREFIGDATLAPHLNTFRAALDPAYDFSVPLDATIVRLPLRTDVYSELVPRVVPPNEIHDLLQEFIREEISTVMLFLRHLSSIVAKVVDEQGAVTVLATANLKRSEPMLMHDAHTHEISVQVSSLGGVTRSTRWLVVSRSDDLTPYALELSKRVGNDVEAMLRREKLVPNIALAVPIAGTEHVRQHLGQLYTFLPLPITTGFPCLINASFSLTADRQSLRNAEEHAAQGSSHHVLVEWNKLLFSKALPVAWAALLSVAADRDMDIYSLWPSSYSAEAHGQAVYWNQVPVLLAGEVDSRALSVWPRFLTGSAASRTTALSVELLFLDEREEGPYLSALADIGVQLCRIPAYIQRILGIAGCPLTVLSPSSAHTALRSRIPSFDVLLGGSDGAATRRVILDYLLLARTLSTVVDLPLIVADNTHIALHQSSTIECFIFDDAEAALFGNAAPSYSLVRDLPSVLLQLLGNLRAWNVGRPAVADIATFVVKILSQPSSGRSFITSFARKFLTLDSPDLIEWSGRFWSWLACLPQSSRVEHYAAISSLPTLPTSTGGWQAPSAGIYPITFEVESSTLRSLLEACGLTFLHSSIKVGNLNTFNCLRSLRDTPALITQLSQRTSVLSTAPGEAIRELQDMLGDLLATSRLPRQVATLLRGLPIFPVLIAGLAATRSSTQAIASGDKVRLVAEIIPLPYVKGVCFVQGGLPRALVNALGADVTFLTVSGVLQLALDNFGSQLSDMQAVFVQRMCKDVLTLPRSMTLQLSSLRFVSVAAGQAFARPSDVVDPRSTINALLDASSVRIASVRTQAERDIVNGLSQLDLFVKSMTPTIASECIAHVGASSDADLARQLFSLLNVGSFDAAALAFDSAARWIPCADGQLHGPTECRDDRAEMQQQRALFDRVLAVAAVPSVSASLRSRLDWNLAIPVDVLKQQFIACVAEDPSPVATLHVLVQTLASRSLSDADVTVLRAAVAGREWVPVDNDDCASTSFAVLYLDSSLPPFRQVKSRAQSVRTFLLRMGCSERPSPAAILHTLQNMYASNDRFDPGHVRSLLEELDVAGLDSQTMSQLPVPTDIGELHVCSQTYYNDLGSRAYLVQLPDGALRAHDNISLGLARKLAMRDLSSLGIEEEDEEEDMGEALSTRISNVLRQYNQDQTPTEYLANAVDAGASSVSFLVDELDFSRASERLLVPSLGQLQEAGALVVHNNADFSEDDWKGIRRVGLGSKRHQPGNIGRFGLGALAAYHFSEVTMVISGEYFLLLDPSRRFLGKRASRRIKLSDMRVFFPDQLIPFVGLYGFDADTVNYEGTIFRLPLRSRTQAQTSELSKNVMSVRAAQDFIEMQEARVKLAVLFNPHLRNLTAEIRSMHPTRPGFSSTTRIWQLKVSREVVEPHDPALPSAEHTEITITSSFKGTAEVWRTGMHAFSRANLPSSFHGLSEKYLLPKMLSVGVALPRRAQASSQSCSLFSHLPLPITTTLPFHVHASFILAEDRRNIRLDDASFVNSESAYNRHLLAALVPNLYLSVLHHWPVTDQTGDSLMSGRFWPSQRGDRLSQIIVEPLYKTVGSDSRAVCESVTGARIAPSTAIFVGTLHKDVVESLELLRPSNLVTRPVALERTSMQRVDADAAKMYVSRSETRLGELYAEKKITITQLLALIRLILGDDKLSSNLDGLRLLPLADGSLSFFRHYGLGLSSLNDAIFTLPYSSPYSSTSAVERLFPSSRFVHQDACGQLQISLLHSTLQVKPFSDNALAYFVRTRLQPSHEAQLTEEDAGWVHDLWTSFLSLHSSGELHKDLRDLPLIPVSGQQHRHISVSSCGGASTLLATSSIPPAVVDALTVMGASFIDASRLPSPLRSREPVKSMTFSFSSALHFLDRHLWRIGDLSGDQPATLRGWICDRISSSHKLDSDDLRIALSLPLFRVRNGQEFAAANTVQMLPPAVRIEDVLILTSTMNKITPYDVSLANVLKIAPMSFSVLGNTLAYARRPGQVINGSQLSALSNLLQTILNIPRAIQEMRDTLQVPNTHGVYVRPDSLYSRGVAMFVAAFDVDGRRPDVFLHASLARFDPALQAFGMHATANASTFEQCALAVQDATDPAKVESARVVYDFYNNSLPRLPFERNFRWEQFDGIRFIPRAAERRQNIPTLNEYARELPQVVSPTQLVRSEFANVAWTQRAQFVNEPSAWLLAGHASVGTPTADEVVAHIRVLSTISGDSQDRATIAKDVKASYKFLQDRLTSLSADVKLALKRGDLFLNVDDHHTEWTWCSTTDLFLNASDDGPGYKMVRGSLKSYSRLLRALDVQQLESPEKPEIKVTGVEGELRRLRGGFDAKRRAEIGIDVVFIDADDAPGRHPAHKMFLSVCASYFDDQFYAAGMRESVVMGFEPLEVNVETSGGALRRCLDYLYTGAFAPVEREDLQILLDMLALADYWSIEDLKATVQGDLVMHLSPRVYEDVRDYAERYSADILLKSCGEWEKKNRDALRRGVDRSED